MIINCTHKLLKEINKQPVDAEEENVFSWHANVTVINRRKTIVLINDLSRYVIVLHGIKSIHKNIIDDVIVNAIKEGFKSAGITESVIKKYLDRSPEVQYSKTKSRAYVGRMTEVVKTVEFYDELFSTNSLHQPELNSAINLYIFKGLDDKYVHPADELYKMLDEFSGECSSTCKALQLKIKLQLSPQFQVWRRILVPYNISFEELHYTIQAAFNWKDYHLFRFEVFKGDNVIADSFEAYDFVEDMPKDIPMLQLNEQVSDYSKTSSKIVYTYDFGDNWKHDIFIEGFKEHNRPYPICIEANGIAPPEDIGGSIEYEEIIKILNDKSHPEYQETLDWTGIDIDAELNTSILNSDLRRRYLRKY